MNKRSIFIDISEKESERERSLKEEEVNKRSILIDISEKEKESERERERSKRRKDEYLFLF